MIPVRRSFLYRGAYRGRRRGDPRQPDNLDGALPALSLDRRRGRKRQVRIAH